MKQHITVEQLAELTPEQFIELDNLIFRKEKVSIEEAEYYLNRMRHLIKTGKINVAKAKYIGLLRKCNIGKMIEILEIDYTIKKKDGQRFVYLETDQGSIFFKYDNLVDALWDAVRYILESRGFENE